MGNAEQKVDLFDRSVPIQDVGRDCFGHRDERNVEFQSQPGLLRAGCLLCWGNEIPGLEVPERPLR